MRARFAFDGLVVRSRLRLVAARYLCWALVWVDYVCFRTSFVFSIFTVLCKSLYRTALLEGKNRRISGMLSYCLTRSFRALLLLLLFRPSSSLSYPEIHE
jgi:hypothetical protein